MRGNFDFKGNKGFRLIYIFEKLSGGELVKKRNLAQDLSVSEKSIQRDIQDLRMYLAETRIYDEEINIQYDKMRNGYFLNKREKEHFTNKEILVLSKVLLNKQVFKKSETESLLKKLFIQATPSGKIRVETLINKIPSYAAPVKNDSIIEKIWQLTTFILNEEKVSFIYQGEDFILEIKGITPVSINFSDDYFF